MTTDSSLDSSPLKIAVVVGTTRPGRRSRYVADWVRDRAVDHFGDRALVEVLDIASFDLPLLDEPLPAAFGEYAYEHTRRWAEAVASFDGFVFVVPECNHSYPAVLKNAIDFVYAEWNDRAAGFVGFGITGGVRAVEQLRLVLAEVKVAGVRSQVALSLFSDFDLPDATQPGELVPGAHHDAVLVRMFDEIVDWAGAMRSVRLTRVS